MYRNSALIGSKAHASVSKRERLAHVSRRIGLTYLFEQLPRQNCLIVLNYHRIGWPETTAYDPGLYSATPEAFSRQIAYLKRRFDIVTLEEALAFVLEGRTSSRRSKILITFDDGYKDNYDFAFLILRQHQVQGTFFLCTSFVGSHRLPWWDRIATMLRNTQQPVLRLSYPYEMEIDLQTEGFTRALRRVLSIIYKEMAMRDTSRFLEELAEVTGVTETESPQRLFLDWQEAAEMVQAGMAVGAHTHSHELLSRLSLEQQCAEFTQSQYMLQERLGIVIDTLAYPVGQPTSFTSETFVALKKTYFRAAFSFYGGAC